MLKPAAIYGVPLLAGLATAAALLGPGQERPVAAARIRGWLGRTATTAGLRIETVSHRAGLYLPASRDGLELTATPAHGPAQRWRGTTGTDGVAEAILRFERPVGEQIGLELSRNGHELARAVARAAAPPGAARLDPRVPGEATGALAISVSLPRACLVSPLPEPLWVSVLAPRDEEPGAPELRAQVTGGAVGPIGVPASRCLAARCRYDWKLDFTARAHVAELTLQARGHGGIEGRWSGQLAAVPGGMWLDPQSADAGELRIVSPVPRKSAYLSLLGPGGRLAGAVVALHDDADGFARGAFRLPELGAQPELAVLSSDPAERSGAAIGWPLRVLPAPDTGPPGVALDAAPQGVPARTPLGLLADGLAEAVARERMRAAAVRRPIWGFVAAAGIFELLFLWRHGRLTRRRLERHLGESLGGPEAREAGESAAPLGSPELRRIGGGASLLWLIVLAAAVALAFAALAAVAAWAQGASKPATYGAACTSFFRPCSKRTETLAPSTARTMPRPNLTCASRAPGA
ncbi:MAG: hypothetical protein HY744_04920 [Deltaproteobacteria bacterium]|nr:hypothetical protein [Deltaproteobacteria bacterium]